MVVLDTTTGAAVVGFEVIIVRERACRKVLLSRSYWCHESHPTLVVLVSSWPLKVAISG